MTDTDFLENKLDLKENSQLIKKKSACISNRGCYQKNSPDGNYCTLSYMIENRFCQHLGDEYLMIEIEKNRHSRYRSCKMKW